MPDEKSAGTRQVRDFQEFREQLADEWTRRQAQAIKAADPDALVTVGLIQWSVPALLPAGPRHYSAFNPSRQAKYLDFLEVHFYPLASGALQYVDRSEEVANLAYLESVIREVARSGKPVVLAEFGWYGGGKLESPDLRFASEADQARYCGSLLEVSKGWVVGWLNWGFHDHPGAKDCSALTGLLTADGRKKEWGNVFQQWAAGVRGKRLARPSIGARPELDWNAAVADRKVGDEFRKAYAAAFGREQETGGRQATIR